jgi:hypothetical protein
MLFFAKVTAWTVACRLVKAKRGVLFPEMVAAVQVFLKKH